MLRLNGSPFASSALLIPLWHHSREMPWSPRFPSITPAPSETHTCTEPSSPHVCSTLGCCCYCSTLHTRGLLWDTNRLVNIHPSCLISTTCFTLNDTQLYTIYKLKLYFGMYMLHCQVPWFWYFTFRPLMSQKILLSIPTNMGKGERKSLRGR